MFIKQPHDAPSFGGIAPQGALAVLGDRLLVPGGRSVPGCLDRRTGALHYFHLAGSPGANRKLEGGSHVSAIGGVFFNHRGVCTGVYDLETGALVTMLMKRTYPVLTDEACYFSGNPVVACRLRPSGKDKGPRWVLEEQWKCDVDGTESLIKAGERLYAGGKGVVSALELQKDGPPKSRLDREDRRHRRAAAWPPTTACSSSRSKGGSMRSARRRPSRRSFRSSPPPAARRPKPTSSPGGCSKPRRSVRATVWRSGSTTGSWSRRSPGTRSFA